MALFDEYGVAKTTIADIADACGFSTANVHRVFGTKTEIRQAACDAMLQEKSAAAERAVAAADTAREKLEALIRTVHEGTEAALVEHRRMHEMVVIATTERWPPVTAYRARLLALAETIVAHGIASGEFDVPDAKAAALGLHMASFRLYHPLIVEEVRDAGDAGKVEVFLAFALRGLGSS